MSNIDTIYIVVGQYKLSSAVKLLKKVPYHRQTLPLVGLINSFSSSPIFPISEMFSFSKV